jgi:hypothetical protein
MWLHQTDREAPFSPPRTRSPHPVFMHPSNSPPAAVGLPSSHTRRPPWTCPLVDWDDEAATIVADETSSLWPVRCHHNHLHLKRSDRGGPTAWRRHGREEGPFWDRANDYGARVAALLEGPICELTDGTNSLSASQSPAQDLLAVPFRCGQHAGVMAVDYPRQGLPVPIPPLLRLSSSAGEAHTNPRF